MDVTSIPLFAKIEKGNVATETNKSDRDLEIDKLKKFRKIKKVDKPPQLPPSASQSMPVPVANPIKDEITEPVEYGCVECSDTFESKEIYDIHMSGHANNMKCAICNMVLKSLKNYEKHCLRCRPFECQICGRVVRFRPNFIKHMRVHAGQQQSERRKYQCEVCLKEFTSFEYFKIHKKIHNDNINLTCEICGKVFSTLATLKGHSELHSDSGVKPHKCHICGKGFGQRYNLKIHARTHTGEIPFGCKFCNKRFHTESSQRTHLLTHRQQQQNQPQISQSNDANNVQDQVEVHE